MLTVRAGQHLKFTRNCSDGHVVYGKTRKVYVVDVVNGVAKIALHRPIRNCTGEVDHEQTFQSNGFPRCRYIQAHRLATNCKEIK